MARQWDETVDFLVAGSGAGGMAAALTAARHGLKSLIVEKADVYGGSTALSGGGIWVPNNPTLQRAGIVDSHSDVMTYLKTVTGGLVDEKRLERYATDGPQMLEDLESFSPHLRFFYLPGYSDYHPELAGGRAEGRSIEALPFDMNKLGDLAKTQRQATISGPFGMYITAKDYVRLSMVMRTWAGKKQSLVNGMRMVTDNIRGRKMVALGQSLVGRLRLALKENGVPVWLKSPITELVTDDADRVIGAVIERDGKPFAIRATKGVLIATGGFEHNDDMRKKHLPDTAVANYSGGAETNTGDGINVGEAIGATTGLMDKAWWMPVIKRPKGLVQVLVSERCIPGSVIVGPDGKRFTNESSPYVDFVREQIEAGHDTVWFIMDSRAKSRYPFAGVMPGMKFAGSWYKSGLINQAETLDDLAAAVDLPADDLRSTIDRFNEFARSGKDADFGRGDSAYDRYYGDPTLPNPVLDVIDKGPFYAIRLNAGDIGTKGGLLTDDSGRVLNDSGAIPGLYATGNTASSVMGDDYPGAGATIGASMMFGWAAALDAASDTVGR